MGVSLQWTLACCADRRCCSTGHAGPVCKAAGGSSCMGRGCHGPGGADLLSSSGGRVLLDEGQVPGSGRQVCPCTEGVGTFYFLPTRLWPHAKDLAGAWQIGLPQWLDYLCGAFLSRLSVCSEQAG